MLFSEDEATKTLPAKGAVAAGKTGQMYLMDRDSLGKFDPSGVNHVLDVQAIGTCFCGRHCSGADGSPRVVSSGNSGLKVWRINSSGHCNGVGAGVRRFGASRHDLFPRRFLDLCVVE